MILFEKGQWNAEKRKKNQFKTEKDLKKYRDSNIVWLNEPWIYKELDTL